MQKISYQQLIPADYFEYRRAWLDCLLQYPENFGATYEEGLDLKSLNLANAILNSDEYNFAIGAFINDCKVIGMCGLTTDMRLKARHRGEVVQFFVDPKCKGQGIGKNYCN